MSETRNHILKSSLLLFLQKSYRDVTMQEIVKQTGLSKGAFYHYFTGKEELFREIANLFFLMGTTDYAAYPRTSFRDFYRRYTDHIGLSFVKINEFIGITSKEKVAYNFFLILFEAITRFPEFLKMERDIYEADRKAWVQVIAEARNMGEIVSPLTDERIASLFLQCTDGVFIRYINSDQTGSFKNYLTDTFDALYTGLIPKESSPASQSRRVSQSNKP